MEIASVSRNCPVMHLYQSVVFKTTKHRGAKLFLTIGVMACL